MPCGAKQKHTPPPALCFTRTYGSASAVVAAAMLLLWSAYVRAESLAHLRPAVLMCEKSGRHRGGVEEEDTLKKGKEHKVEGSESLQKAKLANERRWEKTKLHLARLVQNSISTCRSRSIHPHIKARSPAPFP
jgi:hypothetical protein